MSRFKFRPRGLLTRVISAKRSRCAVICLGVLVVLGLITGGIGAILLWFGCAIWGAMAAQNWNEDHGVS